MTVVRTNTFGFCCGTLAVGGHACTGGNSFYEYVTQPDSKIAASTTQCLIEPIIFVLP